MPFASRFVDVEETRLHYLEWESEGPPIVIVHGNTHCGGVYAPLGEHLQRGFRVFAVDMRGHGLSGRPDTYSWTDLRDDLTQMIEVLGLRDVLLVAHSRGGGASLLTAAAMPGRVRGVVAYEPTIPINRAPLPTADQAARLRARAMGRRSTFESRDAAYRHFRGRGAFAGWREEYLRAFIEHAIVEARDGGVELASPTSVEAQLYKAMTDLLPWQDNPACQTPVLLVYGELSGRIGEGRDPAAAIRPMFPRSEISVMAGCTHSGPMEQPEVFEQLVRDFAGTA